MEPKFVGFWIEFTKVSGDPSIFNEKIGINLPNKEFYLEYLNKGEHIMSQRRLGIDVLSSEKELLKRMISYYNFFTDGVWIWTSGLIHYLEKYDMELPLDFRNHILKNETFELDSSDISYIESRIIRKIRP